MKKLLISSIFLCLVLGIIGYQHVSAITLDTTATATSLGGDTNATQTISITVGNNPNKMLVVGIAYLKETSSPDINLDVISSVKVGGMSFTRVLNSSFYNGSAAFTPSWSSELWTLKSPPKGAIHITITPVTTTPPYNLVAGAYSLYNVNQTNSIGTTSTNKTMTRSSSIAITPTHPGAWIIEQIGGDYNGLPGLTSGPTLPSNTQGWSTYVNNGIAGASEYNSSPTISSSNKFTWYWNNQPCCRAYTFDTAIELLTQSGPAQTTLIKVNTLNSTAINATWNSSPHAAWYQLNKTSPNGGTMSQYANTTSLFKVVTGLTPGTQYQFTVSPGNSSGIGAGSVKKFNYTTNIASTSPTISGITTTAATVTVTNPSGNFSGYKIYLAPVSTGIYSLIATTSTTSNSYSFSGLTDDTNYITKLATRYAVGSNYSGISANSTTASFYTIPNAPSGLALSQSVVNDLHLTWIVPSGLTNPILGYKIERSIDSGATWITLVANTGNTLLTYDDTTVATGNVYTYRVSVITIAGTSNPTSPVSATVLSAIQLNPTGSSFSFNATKPVISWYTMARNNTNWDMFIDTSNNGTAVSWFHAKAGSSTVSKILGYGTNTITITGTPNIDTNNAATGGYGFQSNNGWLYFVNTAKSVDHYYVGNGTKKHDFTVATDCAKGIGFNFFLVNQKSQPIWNSYTDSGACPSGITTATEGNVTIGMTGVGGTSQYIASTSLVTPYIEWYFNSTSGISTPPTTCSLYQMNNNFTKTLLPDLIACDWSIQQSVIKYYSGFAFFKQGNVYSTNALDLFANTNNLTPDKKLLMTVDNNVLGIPNNTPNVRFILHTSGGDYLVIMTDTNIYYQLSSTVLSAIQTTNRAYQSYYITPYGSSLPLQLSYLTSKNGMSVYANGINNTENIMGITQLISGYTYRGTSLYGVTRTVDPQWTNDQTNIPLITTSVAQFPIFLTVSNAPTNAALMVTNPTYTINSIAGIWTVTILDATRSAEFDIPSGQCGLVYVADVSTHPSIWNYEGQVCATGVNQKTISYTTTLPLNFFTLKYGVTDTYTPSTNGLTTAFHTTIPGTVYTVEIKNSTGSTAQSYTFSVPTNATLDIQHYNVSGVTKPAGLFVSVGGNQIYSAYLGSPLSLATAASFFHQYFSYQGFDFLSFIPLIFASMFTRNTVGIGAALVVVLIATLSFLSVVVIPDTVVYIGIIIAVISMIGYRGLYG